jgi:glycosyltransferase involved in cell wall biosynthesis
MKVAYLTNQYPKTSHTFVRREIESLERDGVSVVRFTLRRTTDPLVTQADRQEAERTSVILGGGALGLARALISTALTAPARFVSALALTFRIARRSERGLLINLVYLAEACVLYRRLRGQGVNHLHAHFGTNSAAVAMLCQVLGGPPFSFTIHGPEEFDKPHLLHLPEKIRRARAVFAVSSFGRSQVYRHCGHQHWKKVHVVHCGVDASFLQAPPSPVPQEPRLVSVGRLSEQKGQLLLIEALGELHRRGRSFHLTLVGDGELRGEVERAISQHGLAGKVDLTGWADESSVRAHMLRARALVLPSFAEGLPVVIMEALALGRPVLSTYVAGIPELVEPGKNGWLVPAGSIEGLTTALDAVLASGVPQLTAMGEDGRRRVRERHDSEKIGRQIAAIFRGLAGPPES